jgi:hypothetical protein
MPWAIPPWLVLVKFLGLAAKEHDKHDNDEVMISMVNSNGSNTNNKDGEGDYQ